MAHRAAGARHGGVSEANTERDPIAWVAEILEAAEAAEGGQPERDPMRVALATADAEGHPSVRYVLLKGFGPEGFVFYTNYQSAKAGELDANPHAALAFHWWSTGVQVRARGSVARVSAAESDAYFASRSRGSQLGAWASDQSRPLVGRAALEAQLEAAEKRFEGAEVPRPAHWGGYRLRPSRLEIWLNGAHRLHDRFEFESAAEGWVGRRLAP